MLIQVSGVDLTLVFNQRSVFLTSQRLVGKNHLFPNALINILSVYFNRTHNNEQIENKGMIIQR